MKRGKRSENGAMTIIEAAFVFPITFFIVFFMVMAGEAYYQYACVKYAVTEAAINGAAQCENPMLPVVESSGVPTSPSAVEVMPYRYILTGNASSIAASVKSDLESKLNAMKPLLFKNMKPTNVSVTISPKMNILISSFPVVCEFEIPLPIRMIFSSDALSFHYSVQTTASVGDPAEFVRNVSIVSDLIERSEQLTNAFGKIQEAMEKIGAYTN